jgi:hypothetical protein
MKAHRSNSRKSQRTIRLWTLDRAQQAVPYMTSILQSLREHHLEQAAAERRVQRLDARPGRLDRSALIARDEAVRRAAAARDRFDAALRELDALDVFCLDPVQGEAAVPFQHGERLAWFLLDLFAETPLQAWRYHEDAPGLQRPLAELEDRPADAPQDV